MWKWPLHERYPVKREVIVNTTTELTFRGVLWSEADGYLVLRNAATLKGREAIPVDGEVVIPRENVDFLQVVDAR